VRPGNEPPVGELFRNLSQDAAMLVKQEIALAKLEARAGVKVYTDNAANLALAAGLALLGAFALTAFVIVALGDLFDNYWLSALLVSVALLGTAMVLAKRGLGRIKERGGLKPQATAETLREDKQWAKHEVQSFKNQMKA
jgi:hypothetical protein